MLEDTNAVPMLAVKNLDRSRRFYEHTLGLHITPASEPEMFVCQSGGTQFIVYTSEYAGTNKANTLFWDVGENLEETVNTLRKKDVVFEHYKLPNTTLKGDVHVAGTMKLAWFKDPDGNILHIVGR